MYVISSILFHFIPFEILAAHFIVLHAQVNALKMFNDVYFSGLLTF